MLKLIKPYSTSQVLQKRLFLRMEEISNYSIDIVEYISNLSSKKLRNHMRPTANSTEQESRPNYGAWLELVRDQVNSLAFGVIQIVVHDSRVVQIERTEKVRLDRKQFDRQPPARPLEAREPSTVTDPTTGETEL